MHTAARSLAITIASLALLAGPLVGPAGAGELFVDDPSSDVVRTDTGGSTARAVADILGVTIVNEPSMVQVTVDVDDVVTFPVDPFDTTGEEFDLEILLTDAADTARLPLVWGMNGIGERLSGDLVCMTETEIDEVDGAYILTADEACARKLSRSLHVSVTVTHSDGSVEAQDVAPDTGYSEAVSSAPSAVVERLAGVDRVVTAIEVSADDFADGTADVVVLASAYAFPDALAGGPFAAYRNGPMLLTATESLDSRTLAEIRRVLPPGGAVYVLGGTAAVSEQVVDEIADAGFVPERLAGTNRFETAVAIADALGTGRSTVLIADGRSFTDALVAGAAAPAVAGVLVLTDGDVLPPSTRGFLQADTSDQIAIGTKATAAVGPTFDSITGASDAELSVNVIDDLIGARGAIAVASRSNFPDSLAGGPHIARRGGGLLLTDPSTLSPEVRTFIDSVSGRLREVTVYGGTAAVAEPVFDAIEAALAP